MSSKKPKALDSLRARVRRLQFIVGLGFFAMVVGRLLTAYAMAQFGLRLQDVPEGLHEFVAIAVRSLWMFTTVPLICYVFALILELKPLPTAIGTALTGALFLGAINYASAGVDGLWEGWAPALFQAAVSFGGMAVTYRAVMKGRAAAEQRAAKAQVQAESRKAEYMEFLQEAEKGAEKTAQREAERAAAVASTGGAAVVVAPEGGAPGQVAAQPSAPAAEGSASPASPSPSPAEESPKAPDAPAETKASTPEG